MKKYLLSVFLLALIFAVSCKQNPTVVKEAVASVQ